MLTSFQRHKQHHIKPELKQNGITPTTQKKTRKSKARFTREHNSQTSIYVAVKQPGRKAEGGEMDPGCHEIILGATLEYM